jgi:hypothetical protein
MADEKNSGTRDAQAAEAANNEAARMRAQQQAGQQPQQPSPGQPGQSAQQPESPQERMARESAAQRSVAQDRPGVQNQGQQYYRADPGQSPGDQHQTQPQQQPPGQPLHFDRAEIDRRYQDAFRHALGEAQMKADQAMREFSGGRDNAQLRAALGGGIGGVLTTVNSICDDWGDISAMLDRALSFLAWIPGLSPYVAKARAGLQVVSTTFIPMVCGLRPGMTAGGTAGSDYAGATPGTSQNQTQPGTVSGQGQDPNLTGKPPTVTPATVHNPATRPPSRPPGQGTR